MDPKHGSSKLATVVRVTSGNFLEMFDFFLFGFYASHIAQAFFPSDNEIHVAPLHLHDLRRRIPDAPAWARSCSALTSIRSGGGSGLIVTLSIMAMGTILIAFVPSYATIGALAPLLVLIGRLLQGFSAGVELGGVSVYLSEMATPVAEGVLCRLAVRQPAGRDHHRGGDRLRAQQGCSPRPSHQRLGMAHSVLHRLPDRARSFSSFRRSLAETEAFMARTHRPNATEAVRSIISNWQIVLAGMLHGRDDDGLVLSHYRLHPDLRQEHPAAGAERRPDRDVLRRARRTCSGCR